ncbi:helicase subunit [Salmonella enterica]|nr:helicase subunit [Salmonella enterica]EBA9765175.1 helicase subunit [Salmonella enterica]EGX5147333.1 helicase subunit [Salmonella enterica]
MKKVTNKHNVLQEEDGVQGKCMINRGLRMVMN